MAMGFRGESMVFPSIKGFKRPGYFLATGVKALLIDVAMA